MAGDQCPTGCGRTVRPGHLMCRPCWGEVPRELQRDVNRTWRAWSRDIGDTAAMQAYKDAREAALAAVA